MLCSLTTDFLLTLHEIRDSVSTNRTLNLYKIIFSYFFEAKNVSLAQKLSHDIALEAIRALCIISMDWSSFCFEEEDPQSHEPLKYMVLLVCSRFGYIYFLKVFYDQENM